MHIHVLQYTVYPVKQSVVVDVKITEVMWIQYNYTECGHIAKKWCNVNF